MTRAEKAARIKEIVYKHGSFLFEQIGSVPITFVDNRTNTPMIGKSVSFNVINCEKPDGFYQAYEISSQYLPESIVDQILMSAEKWAHDNIQDGAPSIEEIETSPEKQFCVTVIFGKHQIDKYCLNPEENLKDVITHDFHFETKGELNAFIEGMRVGNNYDEFYVVK